MDIPPIENLNGEETVAYVGKILSQLGDELDKQATGASHGYRLVAKHTFDGSHICILALILAVSGYCFNGAILKTPS